MRSPVDAYRMALCAVALLLCAAMAGCSDDPTEPEPAADPRSTRMGLIEAFETAYVERDIEAYAECLHPDYAFSFWREDVGNSDWWWGEWFGAQEDVAVTDSLFRWPRLVEIRVDLENISTVPEAESAEDRFFEFPVAVGAETLLVWWADFDLDMHVVADYDGDQVDYWIDCRIRVYLAADPDDEDLWTIWGIEDWGNEFKRIDPASMPLTLSALKVMFWKAYGKERSTRMGTLALFARAHERRAAASVDECLDEDYQFWFYEDDVGNPNWQWSEWIGRTEDLEVTGRMFRRPEIVEVRLSLANETDVSAPTAEDRFREHVVNTWGPAFTVYWGEFRVDVHVVEDRGDDHLDHWVDGRAEIYLRPDPNDPSLWTIWKIVDLGNRGKCSAAAEGSTWSGLKAMYR